MIVTLIAAKIEEAIQPSYYQMIHFIATNWSFTLTKKELVVLEQKVIIQLDFDLRFIGPILFLERFQRIFNLDQLHLGEEVCALDFLARKFCRIMLRQRCYLMLKPSQVAAASISLAINLVTCGLAAHFGIQKQPSQNLKALFCDEGLR